jgi:spore photoproduct lyase
MTGRLEHDPDTSPPSVSSHDDHRGALVTATETGEFWKPCPGTTAGYHCCGYQILTPLTGCGMYCAYCVLQVYLARQAQVVYTNFNDLEREVHEKMARWNRRVVRFGTGEFGDSLFLEPRLGLSRRIAALLAPYPNALVEFKTKSDHVAELSAIARPEKVVIGFSMNTPRMIAVMETGTASLERRLAAIRRCEDMGFWVAIHYDPIIHYSGWESDYREVVRRIFGAVHDPSRIAWWSLGGFRTMPALKEHIRGHPAYFPLFSGEMILGEDHKLRYFRPVRTAFYRAVREEIEAHVPATTLYLCMESPEVWRDAGMAARIPQGLVAYLDARARSMLAHAE